MGSVLGKIEGYEAPKHKVVDSWSLVDGSSVQIRVYQPRISASYTYTAEEGTSVAFRKIAGFIFGKNTGEQKVAMTVPVATEPAEKTTIAMTVPVSTEPDEEGRKTMRFFMPSEYTMETLPKPEDPDVVIEELPEMTAAVVTFSGNGESYFESMKNALIDSLEGRDVGVPQVEQAQLHQFNPPWTPSFWRTNEVVVPLKK